MLIPSISLIVASVSTAFGEEENLELDTQIGNVSKYIALIAGGIYAFSYMFYAFWQ